MKYKVALSSFDGNTASYRNHGEQDPIHQYVKVSIDRDRFNYLKKPGYLIVTIEVAKDDE